MWPATPLCARFGLCVHTAEGAEALQNCPRDGSTRLTLKTPKCGASTR